MGIPDCVDCKTKMKPLFGQKFFCPNDCDKPELKKNRMLPDVTFTLRASGRMYTCSCGAILQGVQGGLFGPNSFTYTCTRCHLIYSESA